MASRARAILFNYIEQEIRIDINLILLTFKLSRVLTRSRHEGQCEFRSSGVEAGCKASINSDATRLPGRTVGVRAGKAVVQRTNTSSIIVHNELMVDNSFVLFRAAQKSVGRYRS